MRRLSLSYLGTPRSIAFYVEYSDEIMCCRWHRNEKEFGSLCMTENTFANAQSEAVLAAQDAD